MVREVLDNLLASVDEPMLFNTDESDLEVIFNGKHLLFAHEIVDYTKFESCIENIVNGFKIPVTKMVDATIWINLKGNISIGKLSDMVSSNEILAGAILSCSCDESMKEIEISMIVSSD